MLDTRDARRYSVDTVRYSTILIDTLSLAIASIYLYWSGESRKIQIRLHSAIAFSGDIVLPGVYLSLCFMRPGCINASRQNNTSHSQFATSFNSCAATLRLTPLQCFIFVTYISLNDVRSFRKVLFSTEEHSKLSYKLFLYYPFPRWLFYKQYDLQTSLSSYHISWLKAGRVEKDAVSPHTDEVLVDSVWNSHPANRATCYYRVGDNSVLTARNFSQFYEVGSFIELCSDFHGLLRSLL